MEVDVKKHATVVAVRDGPHETVITLYGDDALVMLRGGRAPVQVLDVSVDDLRVLAEAGAVAVKALRAEEYRSVAPPLAAPQSAWAGWTGTRAPVAPGFVTPEAAREEALEAFRTWVHRIVIAEEGNATLKQINDMDLLPTVNNLLAQDGFDAAWRAAFASDQHRADLADLFAGVRAEGHVSTLPGTIYTLLTVAGYTVSGPPPRDIEDLHTAAVNTAIEGGA